MSGARDVAFEILDRVERAGAFASVLLEHHERRLGDPRDAALVHEIVLGVLRRRAALDHALGRAASRPPGRMDADVRGALRIGAYSLLYLDRVPDFAAVDSAVALVKRRRPGAAGFANAVLRQVAAGGRALLPGPAPAGDVAALALEHSYPPWWAARLVERLGWDAAVLRLAADNAPAATVLRTNLRLADPDGLARRLADSGLAVEPGRFVPASLRLPPGSAVRRAGLGDGSAWVQDEASQLVPLLFGAGPAGDTADVCAAPGTKTMQLAEGLATTARLVAIDRHRGRLARLARAAARLRVEALHLVLADMAAAHPPLSRRFARVLADAPCSGTGTLRRRPEIRWRLDPADFPRLAARQGAILENAARLVVAGGRLVYSVCSTEPEEGERVVRAFLDRHPEFEVVHPREDLPAPCAAFVGGDGFVRTEPGAAGLDGFFAAALCRR